MSTATETSTEANVDCPRVDCPRCEGKGGIKNVLHLGGIAHFRFDDFAPCILCESEGCVSADKAEAYARGREMRADRVRRGLSIREEAVRLGMEPRDLNELERGRVEKGQAG